MARAHGTVTLGLPKHAGRVNLRQPKRDHSQVEVAGIGPGAACGALAGVDLVFIDADEAASAYIQWAIRLAGGVIVVDNVIRRILTADPTMPAVTGTSDAAR